MVSLQDAGYAVGATRVIDDERSIASYHLDFKQIAATIHLNIEAK